MTTDECTHELFYLGLCVSCGVEREYDDDYGPSVNVAAQMFGCQNRGWYHDGSENEEAFKQGRPVRPCPYHSGVTL